MTTQQGQGRRTVRKRQRELRAFTLIEVMFSMFLLTIALLGLAVCIPAAVKTNHRSRLDSEATLLAQKELEQMAAQALTAASFSDAEGNSVSLAAGGSPLLNGAVDFSPAAVSGYNATMTATSAAQYELRWNVQALADGAKQFTVGARKKGSQRFLMPPVNLSLRVGK